MKMNDILNTIEYDLDKIDFFITDIKLDEEWNKALEEKDVRLITV